MWLETWAGSIWQTRWEASGAETHGKNRRGSGIETLVATASMTQPNARRHFTLGISCLISLQVLRLRYDWLVTKPLLRYLPARPGLDRRAELSGGPATAARNYISGAALVGM